MADQRINRKSERPPLFNIFEQELTTDQWRHIHREFDRDEAGEKSFAHISMNPNTKTPLHRHKKTAKILAFTRGNGTVIVGDKHYKVEPGNVLYVPAETWHMLSDTGITSFEYLAIFSPAFDQNDVETTDDPRMYDVGPPILLPLPAVISRPDSDTIIAHEVPELDTSLAFDRVSDDQDRRKSHHFHEVATECLFVIEGKGKLAFSHSAAKTLSWPSIQSGNWISIPPGKGHFLTKLSGCDQDLVVLWISTPAFNENDFRLR